MNGVSAMPYPDSPYEMMSGHHGHSEAALFQSTVCISTLRQFGISSGAVLTANLPSRALSPVHNAANSSPGRVTWTGTGSLTSLRRIGI